MEMVLTGVRATSPSRSRRWPLRPSPHLPPLRPSLTAMRGAWEAALASGLTAGGGRPWRGAGDAPGEVGGDAAAATGGTAARPLAALRGAAACPVLAPHARGKVGGRLPPLWAPGAAASMGGGGGSGDLSMAGLPPRLGWGIGGGGRGGRGVVIDTGPDAIGADADVVARHRAWYVTNGRGQRLFVQRWLPHGPPRRVRGLVYIVHGLNDHSGLWSGVAAGLVAAGYAVVAHDWHGHGRSEGVRGYVDGVDQLVGDVHTVVAATAGQLDALEGRLGSARGEGGGAVAGRRPRTGPWGWLTTPFGVRGAAAAATSAIGPCSTPHGRRGSPPLSSRPLPKFLLGHSLGGAVAVHASHRRGGGDGGSPLVGSPALPPRGGGGAVDWAGVLLTAPAVSVHTKPWLRAAAPLLATFAPLAPVQKLKWRPPPRDGQSPPSSSAVTTGAVPNSSDGGGGGRRTAPHPLVAPFLHRPAAAMAATTTTTAPATAVAGVARAAPVPRSTAASRRPLRARFPRLQLRLPVKARTGWSILRSCDALMEGAATYSTPLWIGHAAPDPVTRVAGSRAFAAAVGSEDVTLAVYPTGGHDLVTGEGGQRVLADMVSWMQQRGG
ncbi:hypothetical protein MMPV_004512 [Pyropia vietnamensis]